MRFTEEAFMEKPSIYPNGHGTHNGHHAARHSTEQRILSGIDRTAQSISDQIERLYARFGEVEDRIKSWANVLETHPGRTLAVSFFTGFVVGAWLTKRD
jgi:hypothetical protein